MSNKSVELSLEAPDKFVNRHIGPRDEDIKEMTAFLGVSDLDELIQRAMPEGIRLKSPLRLPPALSEYQATERLRTIAGKNKIFKSYLGMGYYDCITPTVIQRNILENPGWYTQYTPYQAEISQGRLEALLNFQTMVCEMTALEIANASLLDEATACAEAMTMSHRLRKNPEANKFIVAADCHPQNISVVKTHAKFLDIEVVVLPVCKIKPDKSVFGVLVQYPATDGTIHDFEGLAQSVHSCDGLFCVATDLMALALVRPPGEFGADIAVGSSQRFGMPMGFGGPHAAFFATRDAYKRQMPGRLVGISKDSRGKPALRLALGTREQHIRREKATSNICTAQSLPAIMASMYAVYHGPDGIKRIAERIHRLACLLAYGLGRLGYTVANQMFFDTLRIESASVRTEKIVNTAKEFFVNIRMLNETTTVVALDETTTMDDVKLLLKIYNNGNTVEFENELHSKIVQSPLTEKIIRKSKFLRQQVFNRYHSETEMLRYMRRLESRDLSLTASMIPLGSCTMKLNPASALMPISWREFARLHPYAPSEQTEGYAEVLRELAQWLLEITGFDAITFQPTAGSQGEYTGLLAIRAYHKKNGQAQRDVCLIPQSAHGTNPASAAMAGLKVVTVACDRQGNIDIADLKAKAQEHKEKLAALMVTYPSTHGVFEETIKEVCEIIHQNGGLVYMDGANMNALAGLCRPAELGCDICHLNLHKTFGIPHGGGGPGAGPVCAARHLAPFLPAHPLTEPTPDGIGAVSAAPNGSALILIISWFYIATLGADGIAMASKVAILNANYIAKQLDQFYPVLYRGKNGWVAHECILDLRKFKSVTVEDLAKRLMDYGFHAPTISWPVSGTVMVEPTESESKYELDRFCHAMTSIYQEIIDIETGKSDKNDNLLKNAPHTADMVCADYWKHPYPREKAAYPAPWLYEYKFWASVGRVDNVYGDRNPICVCGG